MKIRAKQHPNSPITDKPCHHMMQLRPLLPLCALVLLAACQTTTTTTTTASTPAAPAATATATTPLDAPFADISGNWEGSFTNNQGRSFAVSFVFAVDNGAISGTGNIPSSSIDKHPTVRGSISGKTVTLLTNSGFRYNLGLSGDGNQMSGPASGANSGTIRLTRQ